MAAVWVWRMGYGKLRMEMEQLVRTEGVEVRDRVAWSRGVAVQLVERLMVKCSYHRKPIRYTYFGQ